MKTIRFALPVSAERWRRDANRQSRGLKHWRGHHRANDDFSQSLRERVALIDFLIVFGLAGEHPGADCAIDPRSVGKKLETFRQLLVVQYRRYPCQHGTLISSR